MEIENPIPKNEQSRVKYLFAEYGGFLFGLFFLGVWFFTLKIPDEEGWGIFIQVPIFLLALQVMVYPFRIWLKRYFVTRIFYLVIQISFGLVFILAYIYALFGRVFIAIIGFISVSFVALAKSLEFLEVENPVDIALFFSFTFSTILFSYRGNLIVNWLARKMDSGNKDDLERDLEKVNKYLGQSQIRFLIYSTYFFLICLFTLIYLLGKANPDDNFVFLSLQSFAAFIAFDTAYEKRALMKPWLSVITSIPEFFKELVQIPLKEENQNDKDKK